MSSLSITGKLYSAGPKEQKSENFAVRHFTIEIIESANGQTYTNYAGFQLANEKCDLLNSFQQQQLVTVHFNIRGSLWQGKTITNLQAWKIEAVAVQQPQAQPQYAQPTTQQFQQQPVQPAQQQWQPQPQQPPQQFTQPQQPAQQQQWQPQPQQPQQWQQQPQQQQQWAPNPPAAGDLPF